MKKEKGELIRLQSLIESNRLNNLDNFEELLLNDLHKLLSDYFDFNNMPTLKLLKDGNVIEVKISLVAKSIKNFFSLSIN